MSTDASQNDPLKQIDPGTGLTLEDLIDACISNPKEAKRMKNHISNMTNQEEHNGKT